MRSLFLAVLVVFSTVAWSQDQGHPEGTPCASSRQFGPDHMPPAGQFSPKIPDRDVEKPQSDNNPASTRIHFPIPHKTLTMADEARGYLIRQFETAWKLTNFHLDGLATEECFVAPCSRGVARASSP